ncbi:MAG TPA: gliding motility-associated C-terminal domain-containing protein [Puia sp.]|nr:gliding motility-associated C-terminal domain-containing protein [Puia sp.]
MKMQGQDSCHQVPLRPIFILNNPRLLAAAPCSSGFAGVPFWYPTSTEMLVGFLEPCTNYNIPDTTYISGAVQTPQAGLLPVVPQPVPDGAGVLAIGDYGFKPGSIYVNPDYKSFASTCLTQKLRKDSLYRFDFYAGFGVAGSEFLDVPNQLLGPQFSTTPETFGLFGRPDCSAVGNPIPLYSCVDRAGWIPLGEVTVKGSPGAWSKASILFTPPMDIAAIAVGPGCDTNFSSLPFSGTHNGQGYNTNRYAFFLDSLQFYGADTPPPIVTLVSGDSCSSDVILQMQPGAWYAASSLQWYRNDSLLRGQQDSLITVPRANPGTDTFRCTVSNDSLCLTSNPVLVMWTPLPAAASLGAADTTVCLENGPVTLDAFIDSAFKYVWQDGSTNPWFKATRDGTYTVTVSNGCGSARAQKTVRFVACDYNVYVPNAFTPNADGNNDRFRPHFFNPPSHFSMQIFNRGGQQIFSTTNPATGWDGTFDNSRQPAGGYIWYINFTDIFGKPHSLNGTLLLIR